MGEPDYATELAERHVREAEERVAQQTALADRLDEAGRGWAAEEARKMLEPMLLSLEIARAHLVIVRALTGLYP